MGRAQLLDIGGAGNDSPCFRHQRFVDSSTGVLVLQVLDQVNRELGTTIAVITHNAAIAGMGDRVIRMRSGQIVDESRNVRRLSPTELSW